MDIELSGLTVAPELDTTPEQPLQPPLLLIVFAISFVFALMQNQLVLEPGRHLVSDMAGYISRAERLARGAAAEPFDRFYPPGTSYFFAAVFALSGYNTGLAVLPVILAACIAGAATLAVSLAAAAFQSRAVTLLTAIAVVSYWPFAALTSFYMPEPLAALLLTSATYGIVRLAIAPRLSTSLIVGMLVMSGILVRPYFLPVHLLQLGLLPGISRRSRSGPEALVKKTPRSLMFLAGAAGALAVLAVHLHLAGAAGLARGTLSTNDAFNAYLGQSRRRAVGALDPESGSFYVFHNNNWPHFSSYLPLEVVPSAITSREEFSGRVASLWRKRPLTQFIISLENGIELFAILPSWPLVSYEPEFENLDYIFQLAASALAVLPSLLFIFRPRSPHPAPLAILLVAPLLPLTLVAAATSGQPRYLAPFLFLLFPVGASVWCGAMRGRVRKTAGLVCQILVLGGGFGMTRAILDRALVSRLHQAEVVGGPELTRLDPPIVDARSVFWWNFTGTPVEAHEVSPPRAEYSLTVTGFLGDAERPTGSDKSYTPAPQEEEFADLRGEGALNVRFPPCSASHLALHFEDDVEQWRTAALQSGTAQKVVARAYPSRWVSVSLGEEAVAAGRATVYLRQLTGPTVRVRSAVLYQAADSGCLTARPSER